MASAEHCGRCVTSTRGLASPAFHGPGCLDCPGTPGPSWNLAGGPAVHPAKREDFHAAAQRPPTPCDAAPAQRPQGRGARMAQRGKQRRQEDRAGPGPLGTQQAGPVMRRAGHEGPGRRRKTAAPSVPQMGSCPGRPGQPWIARHHQGGPACPARPRDLLQKCGARRRGVMPEHHAAQPHRQPGDGRQGIGHARPVGEQPQRRQPPLAVNAAPTGAQALARLDLACPRDKPWVHGKLQPAS